MNEFMPKARIFGTARRWGMTLVELLVVIAVVALLAALTGPALKQAKALAVRMGCINNQRQLFFAARMFADENDGSLPARAMVATDERWPAAFQAYLNGNTGVYRCPSAKDDAEMQQDPFSNAHNNTSYIINGFNDVMTYNTPSAMKVDRLSDPSGIILFGESKNGDGGFYMDLDEGNEQTALDTARHSGGACYVFADGHAGWIRSPQTVTEKLWWVNKSYVPPSL